MIASPNDPGKRRGSASWPWPSGARPLTAARSVPVWLRGWLAPWKADAEEEVANRQRDFLSDETKQRLRAAVEDEVRQFWAENREEILSKMNRVVAQSMPALGKTFRERWGPKLFQDALLPAWQSSEPQIMQAIESYANDFTQRRLLTAEGGPRLSLAYALRSSLRISDAPLLVFVAAKEGTNEITYRPLIRPRD